MNTGTIKISNLTIQRLIDFKNNHARRHNDVGGLLKDICKEIEHMEEEIKENENNRDQA